MDLHFLDIALGEVHGRRGRRDLVAEDLDLVGPGAEAREDEAVLARDDDDRRAPGSSPEPDAGCR